MNEDMKTTRRQIPGYMIAILIVLILSAAFFCRKYYIAYQHPYKDSEIVGTWDYSWSVTFNKDGEWQREDEEVFDYEMYLDTELVFNDDGTFSMSIQGVDIVGTWALDEHVSNLFKLTPDSSEYSSLIYDSTVRYDRTEDELFLGFSKDSSPEELPDLFEKDEVFRAIHYKTYRDRTRIVYRGNDDNDEDDWDDNDDNGLPYNYHP